jgi:ABC-2 type transport system permease protein
MAPEMAIKTPTRPLLAPAAFRYARLLGLQLRVSLLQGLQYRWDFLIQGGMQLLWLFLSAVPLFVAYKARAAAHGAALSATDIGGWGFYPACVVFGFFSLLKAILDGAVSPSLTAVVDKIRKGTLDFVLLKPADGQFLVSTAHFEPWHVIDATFAVGLIAVALAAHYRTAGHPPPASLAGALAAAAVMFVCAVLILYALWLLVVCAAFYVVRIDNLAYLFSSVIDFARWPRSVFRGALAVLFTYVLPLAVMTSFPADALLGRLRSTEAAWAVASAAALLWLSRRVWRRAIASYTSASS